MFLNFFITTAFNNNRPPCSFKIKQTENRKNKQGKIDNFLKKGFW